MTDEKQREYQRAYRAANREKLQASNRAYRARTREKRNAWQREYYRTHREIRQEYQQAYSAANREKISARIRAEYEWLKAHGICTRCRREDAMINSTVCSECAEKMIQAKRRRFLANPDQFRRKANEQQRKRYATLRAERLSKGLCPVCGRERKDKRFVCCLECRIAQTRRRREKRIQQGTIPRELWTSLGLCYFCGQQVDEIPNSHVCAKHREMLDKLRSHPNSKAAQEQRIERLKAEESRRFLAYLHSKGITPNARQLAGKPLPPRHERTDEET